DASEGGHDVELEDVHGADVAQAEDEREEDGEGKNAGDGLVAGERAREHTDGHEEQAGDGDEEVAAEQRTEVDEAGVGREEGEDVEEAAGGGPQREVEQVGGGVFAEHDLGGGDRGGEQGFQRALATFLGDAFHGEQRDDEDHGQPEELKEHDGGRELLSGAA